MNLEKKNIFIKQLNFQNNIQEFKISFIKNNKKEYKVLDINITKYHLNKLPNQTINLNKKNSQM